MMFLTVLMSIFLNYDISCCTTETLAFENVSYVVLNRETFVKNVSPPSLCWIIETFYF